MKTWIPENVRTKAGSNLLKEKYFIIYIRFGVITFKNSKQIKRRNFDKFRKKKNKKDINIFKEYLIRRSKSEPMAYILGEKEFWSKKFKVNERINPKTWNRVIGWRVIKVYNNKKISILDVGTGSGCIIISLISHLNGSFGMTLIYLKMPFL